MNNMNKFEIGDMVRVKSYEEILKKYTPDTNGDILEIGFMREMQQLCGSLVKIKRIGDNDNGGIAYGCMCLIGDDVVTELWFSEDCLEDSFERYIKVLSPFLKLQTEEPVIMKKKEIVWDDMTGGIIGENAGEVYDTGDPIKVGDIVVAMSKDFSSCVAGIAIKYASFSFAIVTSPDNSDIDADFYFINTGKQADEKYLEALGLETRTVVVGNKEEE